MVVVKIQGDNIMLPPGSKIIKLFYEGFDGFCVFEYKEKYFIYGQYFWSGERKQPLQISQFSIIGGREVSGVKEISAEDLEQLLNS